MSERDLGRVEILGRLGLGGLTRGDGYALDLVRAHFAEVGPTLAAEALAERHGLKVSRETLRGWMLEDRIRLSRRRRKTARQSRLRRGELIQFDGSEHRWFEDRASPARVWSSSTRRAAN